MKKGIFFLLLLIISACNENVDKNSKNQNQYYLDSTKIMEKKDGVGNTYKDEKSYHQKEPIYTLVLNNDSLRQEMTIQYHGRKKINFVLVTSNTFKNESDTIRGVATMDDDQNSDPETDQSNDGIGFLYDNWHYINGECQLAMRIADSAQFIRIFEFNCKGLRKQSCPFETGGVLERVHFQ